MTATEWKRILNERFGEDKVRYREVGKYGWDRLDDVGKDGIKFTHHSGPHYIDASPIPSNGYLLGTYDYTRNEGKFFVDVSVIS